MVAANVFRNQGYHRYGRVGEGARRALPSGLDNLASDSIGDLLRYTLSAQMSSNPSPLPGVMLVSDRFRERGVARVIYFFTDAVSFQAAFIY